MPYTRYIRFLITLGNTWTDIIHKMSDLGIDVSREQIEKTKRRMMLPRIFEKYAQGDDINEKYILQYAKEFQIEEAWSYHLCGEPEEMEEALDLVKEKNIRFIPVILKVKGEEKVYNCMKEMGLEHSKKSVNLLLKYFFDFSGKNIAEIKQYFKKYPKIGKLLDKPLDFIKYKFGITPALEYDEILRDLMHLSYFKSKENLTINTPNSVRDGKKLADIAIKAGEKLEKYGGSSKKDFLEEIEFQFEEAGVDFDIEEEPTKLL